MQSIQTAKAIVLTAVTLSLSDAKLPAANSSDSSNLLTNLSLTSHASKNDVVELQSTWPAALALSGLIAAPFVAAGYILRRTHEKAREEIEKTRGKES